jgi:hypothetical protein
MYSRNIDFKTIDFQKYKKSSFEVMLISAKKKPPKEDLNESAVNYGLVRRFCKRQQMQWSPKGAHLLLQMRTRVLNGEWEQTFQKRYPRFRVGDDGELKKTA